ncbi:MAG: ABC transporter permease, partial [Bacteroidales bacterium]
MIKNYLLVAIRYLFRQKLFSIINILGLSVGIAAFYLIFLHVQDEYSYDTFHQDADRKYRVALERIYPEKVKYYAIVPHSIPEAIMNDLPEVESMVRLFGGENEFVVTMGEEKFTESNAYFADSNFFEFFNIPLIYGDPGSVLSDPNNIVLTREKAEKYFGDKNPVGEIFTTEIGEATITGVCENLPGKSHLRFNFIGSIMQFPIMRQPLYAAFDAYAYIKLVEEADPEDVEARFPEIVDKYAAGEIEAQNEVSYEDYKAAGNGYNYFLQPLKDIHLHSQLELEISPNSNIKYVRLFILVAVFVILIACINFMNLSTARSSERAREVGIRKVVGADKGKLVFQYLVESFIISLLSLLIGLLIVNLILPVFNQLAEKQLTMQLDNPVNISILAAIVIICGFLAGLYPAFVLSRFRPAYVLKGKFRSSRSGAMLRKGLVVFQFGVSLILVIFSLFVFAQIRFMINSDLGYNKEQVVTIPRAAAFENSKEAFRQEIMKIPDVKEVALSNVVIASGFYFGWQCAVEEYGSEVMTTNGMVIDEHYLDALQMNLIEGRNFSEDFNDSLSVLINRSAIKEFGLKDPIGKKLISRTRQDSSIREYRIVGVVEDFHYLSMHQPINSFVLFHSSGQYGEGNIFNIKISGNNVNSTIRQIEVVWNEIAPDVAFEY